MKGALYASSSVLVGMMISAATVTPAWAQSKNDQQSAKGQESASAKENANEGLPQIVVTARRRREAQQTVPIAVTALSGKALAQANVTTIQELGDVVPSLQIAPTAGRANFPGFAIRGQRQDSAFLTNDPSVSVYFADAVLGRNFGLEQMLYDLESVQVLKGPQGTLFGRNSTGGAILIQPRRPKLGEMEGYALARYGNYDRFDLQGAVSVPLGSAVAARISFNRTRRDGYATNVSTGERLNAEHTDGGRLTLLVQPSDDFSNTLYVDYVKANSTSTASKIVYVDPTGLAQRYFPVQQNFQSQLANLSFYQLQGDVPTASRGSNLGITNVTEEHIHKNLTLKNIMNFRSVTSFERQDLDGTNLPLLSDAEQQNMKQFSEEFQIQGTAADGKLTFITGLYYFREKGFRTSLINVFGGVPNPGRGDATNESYAGFAQFDLKLLPNLTATLGGRYTVDNRRFLVRLVDGTTGACLLCQGAEITFKKPTYTASLAWQVDPKRLLYITTRRGYRSGGFNSSARSAAQLTPFGPETVTDYEIGLKSDWTIGSTALRANLDAFHSDYNDIQRQVLILVGGVPNNSVFNVASAKVDGGEAELSFLPTTSLELTGSASYLRPKYKRFNYVSTGGVIVDQSANTFALIPRFTYRLGARWTLPVSPDVAKITLSGDYYHQSSVFFGEFNDPKLRQGAYGLLSLRLDIANIGGSSVDLALFGRNVLGTKYYTYGQNPGLGFYYQNFGEPRTFGGEVKMRF